MKLFRKKAKDDNSSKASSKKGLSRWKTAPDLWANTGTSHVETDLLPKPHVDYSRPRSGVFGIRLSTVPKSKAKPNVPEVVDRLITALNNRSSLSSPGLFQLPGDPLAIARIREQLNRNMNIELDSEEPYALATLLLNYFKELPTPIIPAELSQNFIAAVKDYSAKEIETSSIHTSTSEGTEKELLEILNAIKECLDLMTLLNDENHSLLKFLVKFLYRVTLYSSINKMDAKRIGETWGNVILRVDKNEESSKPAALMRLLIEHFSRLFPADLVQHDDSEEEETVKRHRATTLDTPHGKEQPISHPDASTIDFREKRTVEFVTDLEEYDPESASIIHSNYSEPKGSGRHNKEMHRSASHGSDKETKNIKIAPRAPTIFNEEAAEEEVPQTPTTVFLNVTGDKKPPKSPKGRAKEAAPALVKKRYRLSMPSKQLSELVHSQAHEQKAKQKNKQEILRRKKTNIVPELEPWPVRKADSEENKEPVESSQPHPPSENVEVKKQRRKREDLSLLAEQQKKAMQEIDTKEPVETGTVETNETTNIPDSPDELRQFVSFLGERCVAVSREAAYLADTCNRIVGMIGQSSETNEARSRWNYNPFPSQQTPPYPYYPPFNPYGSPPAPVSGYSGSHVPWQMMPPHAGAWPQYGHPLPSPPAENLSTSPAKNLEKES